MAGAQERDWQGLMKRMHDLLRSVWPLIALEVLEQLHSRECDTTTLARTLGREPSQVSQCLHELRGAGLVVTRHSGRHHLHALAAGASIVRSGSVINITVRGHGCDITLRGDALGAPMVERKPMGDAARPPDIGATSS